MTTEQMDDKDAQRAGFEDAADQRAHTLAEQYRNKPLQERLAQQGKTSRADAERELDALREAQPMFTVGASLGGATVTEDYVSTQIRVRSAVRVLATGEWAELTLQIRLYAGAPWLDVLAADHPLMVARLGQSNEEHIVQAINRFLLGDIGISGMLDLRWEIRVGHGVTDYQTWLTVRSGLGVAVRTRPDGMLNLYGL